MDNAATYSRPPCTSKHCTESMHVHMLYAHMPAAACMVRPAGYSANERSFAPACKIVWILVWYIYNACKHNAKSSAMSSSISTR